MIGYNDKYSLIPKGCYLFSATSLKTFNTSKNYFYRKTLLKDSSGDPTKNTILGTIVHHIIETILTQSKTSKDEIDKYIDSFNDKLLYSDLDWIRSKYIEMLPTLIEYYDSMFVAPKYVEHSLVHKTSDLIYLGGTLDYFGYDGELKDFKTTTQFSKITEIPLDYKQQLYTYAYLLQKHGDKVEKLTIEYIRIPATNRVSEKTGKALQDYPCEIYSLSEYLDEEFMAIIESKIKMITHHLEHVINNPDLLWLFAEDETLKGLEWR